MDADVFADLRRRLGVNQETLAKMLDVHPVTVNKWERGKRSITKVVELAMWALILFDERDPKRRRASPSRAGISASPTSGPGREGE
jgi:DNA-binding XRE family transcriptional regulator